MLPRFATFVHIDDSAGKQPEGTVEFNLGLKPDKVSSNKLMMGIIMKIVASLADRELCLPGPRPSGKSGTTTEFGHQTE